VARPLLLDSTTMSHHELPSIDPAALDDVTGGASAASSDSSGQLTAALQGITSQIASLKNPKNTSSGSSSMSTLLPMMLMLGKGGGGGACPCGCGMSNCRR
jgi:hypothetical protein